MRITYLIATVLAAVMNGYAATLNFVGAGSVKEVADRVRVPHRWIVPFGVLLAFGAVGLLVGLAVPFVGAAAASGLILYFVCAVTAHLRVHDSHFGGAVFFLLSAVAALVTDVVYRNPG
ncbi:DoxX family protein [Kribbella sp. NPDC006257]|uniref:DoxX family protein n=1 Tax=Kribbella sp. NPDC006257 TaxID=3156738 RepID=UPI0033B8001C